MYVYGVSIYYAYTGNQNLGGAVRNERKGRVSLNIDNECRFFDT